ncbi:MAG: hypothetical protein KFB95_02360 [Simkaniaceae bacterium]|nr:MAG: hypothetical protein KFB95_02360 [Simkaniaceae bacterium]
MKEKAFQLKCCGHHRHRRRHHRHRRRHRRHQVGERDSMMHYCRLQRVRKAF